MAERGISPAVRCHSAVYELKLKGMALINKCMHMYPQISSGGLWLSVHRLVVVLLKRLDPVLLLHVKMVAAGSLLTSH